MTDNQQTLHTGQSALPDIDPADRRRSRIKLVSIFAIFAIPLILASIYLHLVRSSDGTVGDTSRGQLIQPAVPLTDFSLTATNFAEGEFNLDSVRGLWSMLYVPKGDCLEACEQNLYHMRQVRLALNHRMDRVQRIVLVESPTQLDAKLVEEHPGLIVATGSAQEQSQLHSQVDAAQQEMDSLEDAIYLIDPFGNIMLRFPHDLPPKSMLKDIKHLLKVSRIG